MPDNIRKMTYNIRKMADNIRKIDIIRKTEIRQMAEIRKIDIRHNINQMAWIYLIMKLKKNKI